MRLVIATPLYPPDLGGPATYTTFLERELPAGGIAVEVVSFAEVRHLPKLVRHFFYYRKVLKTLRRSDAVLALDPVSVGMPAMKAAEELKKPLLLKVVGDYAWEQGRQRFGVTAPLDEFVKTPQSSSFVRFLQKTQKMVASRAVRIIVPSEYLKMIVSAWGIPETKISVVYNLPDVSEIGEEREFGLSSPRVVTVARLVPWKGIQGLMNAVAKARVHIPSLSLLIIGDGPDRAQLEAHAKTVLRENYLFTGALTHKDTLAAMRGSEVFALNTSYEGFSHVLLEAAALGLPIVTTPSGGNRELLTHDENALLVPPESDDALAESLIRILQQPGLRERLSHHAKTKVESLAGPDALVSLISSCV
ncbi:glycosyltransferase family 4 protein [Patescibacteria group bacterium]|nr:glycosyltransferase family 4 protein [Patescibacteria group bacterium]